MSSEISCCVKVNDPLNVNHVAQQWSVKCASVCNRDRMSFHREAFRVPRGRDF